MILNIQVAFSRKCAGTVYTKLYIVRNERGSVENVLHNIFELAQYIDAQTFHIVHEDHYVETFKPVINFKF